MVLFWVYNLRVYLLAEIKKTDRGCCTTFLLMLLLMSRNSIYQIRAWLYDFL